ncbi:hypothetical protein [Candidatus Mycoplasma haematohominis]|uniref:hypothetical protein n=1 Tax=Candidatus Mycoplasma haematohominis TaxID=1494318 RepID=UPI001C0A702C|nr:hypothetical protein [Candidatus Mycoplasma haemohominis]
MALNNFWANFVALFIGTVSITYAATTDGVGRYGVRVWDQFGEKLKPLKNLNDDGVWDEWVDRWVDLVLSHKSPDHKKIKSNYWMNEVIEIGEEKENEQFLNKAIPNITGDDKYKKENDDQKKALAKKPENKPFLLPKIEKLREECKYAYGKYINPDANPKESWFKALEQKSKKSITDDENYAYWKDVYIACYNKWDKNNLPSLWMTKENKHLYLPKSKQKIN